jgi:hypothetical protein
VHKKFFWFLPVLLASHMLQTLSLIKDTVRWSLGNRQRMPLSTTLQPQSNQPALMHGRSTYQLQTVSSCGCQDHSQYGRNTGPGWTPFSVGEEQEKAHLHISETLSKQGVKHSGPPSPMYVWWDSQGDHHGYIWLHLPELFVLNRFLQGGFFWSHYVCVMPIK